MWDRFGHTLRMSPDKKDEKGPRRPKHFNTSKPKTVPDLAKPFQTA